MEKNIAALMREDCRTIRVEFNPENFNPNMASTWVDEDECIYDNGPQQKGLFKQVIPGVKTPVKKVYTYVTDLPVQTGDLVVVLANGVLAIAIVRKVDDSTNIEPNSSTEYQWVVSRVDLAHYNKTMEQNLKITQAVAKAYKENLRRGFSQQVLLGMPEEQRTELEKLIRRVP